VNAQDSNAEIFDVFLCHNKKDKPEIREISKSLAKEGIKPWLDEEQIQYPEPRGKEPSKSK
jgi:hypothetical protein